MAIVIGANGDEVHHLCHYVHCHWHQWIVISTIGAIGENSKAYNEIFTQMTLSLFKIKLSKLSSYY